MLAIHKEHKTNLNSMDGYQAFMYIARDPYYKTSLTTTWIGATWGTCQITSYSHHSAFNKVWSSLTSQISQTMLTTLTWYQCDVNVNMACPCCNMQLKQTNIVTLSIIVTIFTWDISTLVIELGLPRWEVDV